jgi:hypothetical protein
MQRGLQTCHNLAGSETCPTFSHPGHTGGTLMISVFVTG